MGNEPINQTVQIALYPVFNLILHPALSPRPYSILCSTLRFVFHGFGELLVNGRGGEDFEVVVEQEVEERVPSQIHSLSYLIYFTQVEGV